MYTEFSREGRGIRGVREFAEEMGLEFKTENLRQDVYYNFCSNFCYLTL